MKKATYLSAGLMLISAMSFAGAADSTAAKSPFTFSGYIDSYYFGNLNSPKSRDNLGISGTARAFDQKAGTFGLGLVQTKFGYSNKKSDVVVDLTFGPNADLGQYGNVVGPLGKGYGSTALAIKQAYFDYKATDKLTFTAGQFGTHIGYEVIDAPVNYNYSLSNLFNNGPFYHIGVKANYAVSDKFAIMAGVVNNVDNLYDNNRSKGIIAQVFLSPKDKWTVYINYIGSNEANPGNDTSAFYQLFDLTTGYQVTDKFFVGLNAAYGMQSGEYQGRSNVALVSGKDTTRSWSGAALYTNYAFTDKFGLGIRAEMFDNTSGVRGLTNITPGSGSVSSTANVNKYGGTSVSSITLTANITLADGHLLLKPELRMDSFAKAADPLNTNNVQQFMDDKGLFSKTSQTTIGLAAIYKF